MNSSKPWGRTEYTLIIDAKHDCRLDVAIEHIEEGKFGLFLASYCDLPTGVVFDSAGRDDGKDDIYGAKFSTLEIPCDAHRIAILVSILNACQKIIDNIVGTDVAVWIGTTWEKGSVTSYIRPSGYFGTGPVSLSQG